MEEGETRNALKKGHARGALIAGLLVWTPCLQRAAGHLKHRGRVTLGPPLDVQSALLLTPVSAFEAIPALGAIILATLRRVDDGSHSSLLLLTPRAW
jgi:hypothetical protein